MRSLFGMLIVFGLFVVPASFAEEEKYYYISDHLLERPPVFCAMDFEDVRLPDAPEQLMAITENAIHDWETKLIDATDNPSGWDFQFVRVSVEDQQNLLFDTDCDVSIYFVRQPPKGQWDYAGYADSYLTFSEIRIFYLESIYEYKGKDSNY